MTSSLLLRIDDMNSRIEKKSKSNYFLRSFSEKRFRPLNTKITFMYVETQYTFIQKNIICFYIKNIVYRMISYNILNSNLITTIYIYRVNLLFLSCKVSELVFILKFHSVYLLAHWGF